MSLKRSVLPNAKCSVMLALVLLFCLISVPSWGMTHTFKVGYIEGGPFWVFTDLVDAISEHMKQFPDWDDRVEYPPDAYFSPGWTDEGQAKLPNMAQDLMARTDLDMIVCAGDAATKAVLEANNYSTPILAIGLPDPVKSGFIPSSEDSGINNFTTQVDPDGVKRMLFIFHDVINFSRLGYMYFDGQGEKWQKFYLEDAQDAANERGFELVTYNLKGTEPQQCRKAIEELAAKGIDAFFIPAHPCFDWEQNDVQSYLQFFMNKRIPTFSSLGKQDVEAGALMGFVSADLDQVGAFVASKVIRILHGQQPRSLPMMDDSNPKIYLNLYVARRIDFVPTFSILAATDAMYEKITLPEKRKADKEEKTSNTAE